ncbi:hypothetical protein F5X99DRAFT_377351 [Biscogniauxia marginata]|nr:hypothetical protein F5X99DRAFT_377351 [Biscogniauxia marginata]
MSCSESTPLTQPHLTQSLSSSLSFGVLSYANVVKTEVAEALADLINKQSQHANFVRCDVTAWEDQVAALTSAVRFGRGRGRGCSRLDHAIINAEAFDTPFVTGANGGVASLDEDPLRPDATSIEVNAKGVMYTLKLAQLYILIPTAIKPEPVHTKRIT